MSTSLSIRPWQFERQEQPSVIELLERVNRERGHFRDIIDSSLQEEIATAGALQLSDSEDEQEEADASAAEDGAVIHPTTREELYKAKFEMLQKVSMAHNEVMMALDYISLLESKDSAAGKQTMSQFLKANVPAGTLGTDMWQRMPKDTARESTDERLAYSVRVDALQRSADNLLGAAKTLESNVRRETRYWNEILSVTEGGWNVCRLPGHRQKLGVRFGLSEGSPEFNSGGIAALTADEDGTILLDHGIETRYRAVRVSIMQDQRILGYSKPVSVADEGEATLETHIKHARDALVDEELFRELEREGRSMVSKGIQMKDNAIAFALADGSSPLTVRFELISRNEAALAMHATTSSEDVLAHGILCAAKLLLCQAHRDKLKRRSAIPPPLSDSRKERPLLQILKPLLTLSSHQHSLQLINSYVEGLAGVLRRAGIEVTLHTAHLHETLPNNVHGIEELMLGLLTARSNETTIDLQLPASAEKASVKVRIETSSSPDCKTAFLLTSNNSRDLHATSTRQAAWEVDRLLASMIASALAASSEQWYVNDDDAHLYRENAPSNAPREAEVVVDGQLKVLKLLLPSIERRWTSDEEAGQDIWQAWKDLA